MYSFGKNWVFCWFLGSFLTVDGFLWSFHNFFIVFRIMVF